MSDTASIIRCLSLLVLLLLLLSKRKVKGSKDDDFSGHVIDSTPS